jgi:hypothetical protein
MFSEEIQFQTRTHTYWFCEVAAIEAFTYAFPTVKIVGCFFHFGQCLWRKFVKVGLKTAFTVESGLKFGR